MITVDLLAVILTNFSRMSKVLTLWGKVCPTVTTSNSICHFIGNLWLLDSTVRWKDVILLHLTRSPDLERRKKRLTPSDCFPKLCGDQAPAKCWHYLLVQVNIMTYTIRITDSHTGDLLTHLQRPKSIPETFYKLCNEYFIGFAYFMSPGLLYIPRCLGIIKQCSLFHYNTVSHLVHHTCYWRWQC